MIIQCRNCRTKYRFDEAKITQDGAWVRCTRCQKVFLQYPPLLSVEVNKSEFSDQTVTAGLEKVDMGNLDEIRDFPEISEVSKVSEPRTPARRAWVWVLSVILLLLAAVGGSLFLFPEYGQMAIKELNALFPGLASFTAQEAQSPPAPVIGPAHVKIVDVKQRFVNNAFLGNIRVVEGVAMNASPYPMTRIKVRGELADMTGTLVRESAAFCGNLLTDEELGFMSEEQIIRELANPQGSDIPNDKIAPNGTILFMIVFIREPPGVTRTVVMPAAAERLLSS